MACNLFHKGMHARDVKTLLVGDDESTIVALGRILSMCSMKCDMRLMDSEPSPALLKSTREYDFVILDSMELSSGGLDLLLSMRESKQRKPVIIITNSHTCESGEALARHHDVHLLRKPVEISTLLQSIETVLNPNRE